MSMKIQDALSSCCKGIKEFASSAATWIGKSVTATGSFLSQTATKVAELAKPHFDHLKNLARENRQSLIIVGITSAVSVIATLIMTNLFSKATDPATPPPAPGTPATVTV